MTPTPASKRKKPQIENKGREETSALETGALTPVRKLLQKTRKVTEKIGRIEEVQKGRKEGRNTTDTSKRKEGDEGNKDKTKIQNLITKYLSNKDVLTCPRAVKIFTLKTPTLIINKDSRQSYRLIVTQRRMRGQRSQPQRTPG